MKSYRMYQHQRILTDEKKIAHGDYIINEGELTVRIRNGLLSDGAADDGTVLPAIESADGSHIEHWKDGVLHCDSEPAVIDSADGYEEWWFNGRQVSAPGTA